MYGSSKPLETVAGEARSDTQLGLALGTSQATVQTEELASRDPRHSELPDEQVLGHVNTLDLFDRQTNGFRDFGVVRHSHLHNGNCGGNPIGHLDLALQGMSP
jgi:hypothetical protein